MTIAKVQSDEKQKLLYKLLFEKPEYVGYVVSPGVQKKSSYNIGRRIDAAIDQAVQTGVRNAAILDAK
ncbi:MAG: hypothetical protein H7039_19405 [Bryobacteraceae bacterium]|nr:hypothetical protein [Bryobacteraceae bacterium]